MLTINTETLRAEVAAHIAADALVGGSYWVMADNAVGGRGCFIGCLAHSDDAGRLGARFGLPLPLVLICETIHESLWRFDRSEATAFFGAIPDAVGRDGKDLTRIHWAFLAAELRAFPTVPDGIQAVIDPMLEVMDLLAAGEVCPEERASATAVAVIEYASNIGAEPVASAAIFAADAAAFAAADAADAAARAAARRRQRDTLLALIKAA